MRICIIGKYPPIEGGVSCQTYWNARGLAQRGHGVFVVTNADEVEPEWRIRLTDADRRPGGDYAPAFESSGGFVNVTSTRPPDRSRLYFVPYNNPVVTRLAALSADIVRSERCEIIYAHYLEPYGVAAYLASQWTGVPYVVAHAGSDLHRLMQIDELRTAYVEVLKGARRIISSPVSAKEVSRHVPAKRIVTTIGTGVPTERFNPAALPMEIDQLDLSGCEADPLCDHLEPGWPILGVYGKIGEQKGSFDLLHAIRRLVDQGFSMHLVVLGQGRQEGRFRDAVQELRLTKHVRLLPFVPNWRVPSFIRRCTAVAFLERDFRIPEHTPSVPKEVVACGVCLLLSEEVARKQPFRARLRTGRNVIVVRTPQDPLSLTDKIRFALEDPVRAREIGMRAHADFDLGDDQERAVARLELLLGAVASNDIHDSANDAVQRFFPHTNSLLSPAQRKQLDEVVAGTPHARAGEDLAESLGQQLETILREDPPAPIGEICRYERMANLWRAKRVRVNVAGGLEIGPHGELANDVVPRIAYDYEFGVFDCDIRAVLATARQSISAERYHGRTLVVFSTCAEPLIVGEATMALLDNIRSGTASLTALELELAGSSSPPLRATLEGLYWAGLIEFHSRAGDVTV